MQVARRWPSQAAHSQGLIEGREGEVVRSRIQLSISGHREEEKLTARSSTKIKVLSAGDVVVARREDLGGGLGSERQPLAALHLNSELIA